MVGERYLSYILTRDEALLNFDEPTPTVDHPDQLKLRLKDSAIQPPLPAIAAAISGRVSGRWLRLLDPVESRHASIVLFAALTVATIFLFTYEAIDLQTAAFAALMLSLYPRFFAHAHFNLKDIPKAFFFAASLWLFWRALEFAHPKSLIGAGLTLGLGMATRPNVILAVGICALWMAIRRDRWVNSKVMRVAMLGLLPAMILGFLVGSPGLLFDPVGQLRRLISYWVWLGISDRSTWSLYPLLTLAITAPAIWLVLILWGGIASLRRSLSDHHRVMPLLWMWVLVPVIRASMPYMQIYDGVRHLLEVIPALAIFGGMGLSEIAWVGGRILKGERRLKWAEVGATVLLLPLLSTLVRVHPYELAYFNRLIGGLAGAQRLGIPDATDYWGSSYRDGFRWLNAHASPDSCIYMPEGQIHIAETVQAFWIREDLSLVTPGDLACGQIYVMHTTRPSEYAAVDKYVIGNLHPSYQISIDGAPILRIYELSRAKWREAGG